MSGPLWLDEYERSARLVPGLLVLAPLVVAGVALGVPDAPWSSTVAGSLLALIGPILLAKYVGNRGRAAEPRLYDKWGGPPSTGLLRMPTTGSAGPVLEQRRRNAERVSNLVLPTAPSTPEDGSFEAATRVLRSLTTDRTKFPLVFAELKSYGFERNLYAIRSEGRTSCSVSLAILLVDLIVLLSRHDDASAVAMLGVAAELLLGLFWCFWPSEGRVRDAGTRYAERLLDGAAAL